MLRKKIWRLPEVLNQTGLSRSTIYYLISQGAFPPQVKLGPRAVCWVAADVQDWIDGKIIDAKIDRSKGFEDLNQPIYVGQTQRAES